MTSTTSCWLCSKVVNSISQIFFQFIILCLFVCLYVHCLRLSLGIYSMIRITKITLINRNNLLITKITLFIVFLYEMIKYQLDTNSEHHKIRAKQQHVCKEMNQYMINTNRKWILSFGIEWTIGVKYRK